MVLRAAWVATGLCAAAIVLAPPAWSQEVDARASEPLPANAAIGHVPIAEPGAAAPQAAARAPRGDTVSIYFGTNRNPVPRVVMPERFGNELQRTTLFGRALLDSDLALKPGGIVIEAGDTGSALATPARLAAAAAAGDSALQAMGLEPTGPLAEFALRSAAPQTDVLVFIHGAAHSFESTVTNAARLANRYGRPGAELVTLVFSYPANGSATIFDYFADRRDAGMSGIAMAEAFDKLVSFLASAKVPGEGRVVLIAHSLGVYAMREGVPAIARRLPAGSSVFDTVMIMGGDEDADALSSRAKLRPLLRLTDEVVVYYAPNDTRMWLSRLGNLRKPIGLDGPSGLASANYRGARVYAVDARDFAHQNDSTGHRYHLRSPVVVKDARAVFAGTDPAAITGRAEEGTRLYRIVGPEQGAAGADVPARAPSTSQ